MRISSGQQDASRHATGRRIPCPSCARVYRLDLELSGFKLLPLEKDDFGPRIGAFYELTDRTIVSSGYGKVSRWRGSRHHSRHRTSPFCRRCRNARSTTSSRHSCCRTGWASCRRPSGLVGALANDWTVAGFMTMQSGVPIAVTQANSLGYAGFTTQRPNLIGDPTLPADERTPARWFHTAAFATADQFTIGSASRHPVRVQHTRTWISRSCVASGPAASVLSN